MTPNHPGVDFTKAAFIDLEASSLGSASFPTEIGWAIVREDGSIDSGACLIRPPAKWTIYANAWSAASECLTGITKEMLQGEGLSPVQAMSRFLEAVGDRDLYSDEPDYDNHWLNLLADAAGTSIGTRNIGDAKLLIGKGAAIGSHLSLDDRTPRHRAAPDARRLALAVLSAASKTR
jgi:hypothetical protein